MYKVIADSSADMNPDMRAEYPVTFVPFKLYLEGQEYIDNLEMDVDQFVERFTKSSQVPKSACPSPNDFYDTLKGADEYYIVTITSKLSGTYNSAILGKKIYDSENPNAKVHVFDSLSACCGETLAVKMIHDLKRIGKSFEEVVKEVETFISSMGTLFVSESLNNLIKNGRISKWKGLLATTFSIYPVMGSDGAGEIVLKEKIRTLNKAYRRMVEIAVSDIKSSGKKIVAISHVGNLERAKMLALEFANQIGVEVLISKCSGLSSLYADNKGIVISY